MTTKVRMTPWISRQQPNPNASMRLFCFPYAGGGASIYRDWHKSFPPTIEVCPVQLPGRGERLGEPPFTQIKALVDATAEALFPFFDKPFAFFGHSMGALLGYELAHLLLKEKAAAPLKLFVSGHSAPHLRNREMITYDLPEDEFIAELRRLKGTPKQVLEHPELMTLMIPLLRADFEICETYRSASEARLDCPITAFGGTDDTEVPQKKIEGWREHTSGPFLLHMLTGDHFFIHTSQSDVVRTVVRESTRHLVTTSA
ncbi:MAG: thioesterase II family protein [Pyrinomonadaceae bacterium]